MKHSQALAKRVIARMDSYTQKLKSLEEDIRALWAEFDTLKPGETILGYTTKKEFCEKRLHRTPRAVRYMLNGGNPNNEADDGEIISPPIKDYSGYVNGQESAKKLETFFSRPEFPVKVTRNCAQVVPHYNAAFNNLDKDQVKKLAAIANGIESQVPVILTSAQAESCLNDADAVRPVGGKTTKLIAEQGSLIVLPSEFNNTHEHAVPKDKNCTTVRYAVNAKHIPGTI